MAPLIRRTDQPRRRRTTEQNGSRVSVCICSLRLWCGERVGCLVSMLLYHLRSYILLLGRFNIVPP